MVTVATKNSVLTGRNVEQIPAHGGGGSALTGWVDSKKERLGESKRARANSHMVFV